MIEEVGAFEKMVRVVDKYGLFKIFQALFVFAAFLYIMYNVSNLDGVVRSAFTAENIELQESHDAAVEVRRSIKPEIDLLLKESLAEMDASRAWIMEMHNGTNNTAGLPFIYGEMTYEEVRNTFHVDEEYTSLNLSRFNFPMYLEEKHIWYGPVSELAKIDPKIAARLTSNDVTYVSIISINGVSNELGYFGISFCKDKKPERIQDLVSVMSTTSQRLSILLDAKRLREY